MSAAPQTGIIEAEAVRLWGEPTLRTRWEWRWGKRHSLSLVVSGQKRGLWHDHESGRGGRLGGPDSETETSRRRDVLSQADATDEQRIERARQLWAASEPVQATLGECYLIETRGIPRPPSGWPDAVRYGRGERAPILAATLEDGTVQAVQLVKLTTDAKNATRRDGSKIKLTRGVLAGAVVRLPRSGPSAPGRKVPSDQGAERRFDPLLLTEGPETGLSVWAATGHETWIALGGMAKLLGSLGNSANLQSYGRQLVVCRDDDPPDAPATVALDAAIARARQQGLDVVEATPWAEARGDKSDFNDTLRQLGAEAVRARIQTARLAAIGCAPTDPPFTLPTATLAEADAFLAHVAAEFFAPREETELAPQILLAGQGGIGKTDAVARFVPHGIVPARKAGKPHRTFVLVTEHNVLAPEIVQRYRRLGMDVAHLRGRGDAFDPKPTDPCQNPTAVADAIRAKQDIRRSVCGTLSGPHCALLERCEYEASVERASKADVVVIAHNYAFHRLPKRVLHNVGFVVIDEDFIPRGDRIFSLTAETFSRAALEHFPARYEGNPAATLTGSLAKLYRALHEAIDAAPDGFLTAAALIAAGLTPALCLEAQRLEWSREVPVKMTPGMDTEKRRELAAQAAINSQLPQIVAAWGAVHAILTEGENGAGRIRLTTKTRRQGGISHDIRVHTQHHLASWLDGLPVIMMNATASLEDVRRFFPRAVEKRPPMVASPHAYTRLILGGFAKRTLERSKRKREGLKTWLTIKAFSSGSSGLVTHKSTAHEFTDIPRLTVLTHGANAGADSLRYDDTLTVIDGLRPRATDVASLAAARTGRAIAPESPVETMAPVLMSNGTGIAVRGVLAYADPAMQKVYQQIHGSSVVQGLARSRAVRRTPLDRVERNLFGYVAPEGEVFDEIVHWRDIAPDRLMDMVARRRVHLNAATMATLHDKLFSSERAAEHARARFGDIWTRLRETAGGFVQPWVQIHWQKPGQGNKPEWTFCPASEVAEARYEIEAKFGEPVRWDVQQFTEGWRAPAKDLPEAVHRSWTVMGRSSGTFPAPHVIADRPDAYPHQHGPPDG